MKRVVLIILDGWGISKQRKGNAIIAANPRNFNSYKMRHSYSELLASGRFVGLLPGYMGNSEVGHLHIGAGRLVKQDLARISDAIKDGSFFRNKVLLGAIRHVKKNKSKLHLLGLISDAGVHSHIKHLFALLKLAKMHRLENVYVHAIVDGRDTPPKAAMRYIRQTEKELRKYSKNWKIATVIGRYYAMDRDNRWNREHKAYDAMVNKKGNFCKDAKEAVRKAYAKGESDEFVKPTIVCNEGIVKEGDSIIFFNFRSDRARELTRAFVQGRFNKFKRKRLIDLYFVCLTQYDPKIRAPVAFPPIYIKNTLGEVISKNGLRQFRLAETEKWAHVTYFFNGLSGRIFRGESRLLIPSPKVTTYDKMPAMSAFKIAKKAADAINSGKYAFIVINFANPDMVGHTGKFGKIVKAIRAVDECIKIVVDAASKKDYEVVITADHGNAENKLGFWKTSHTLSNVPLILISKKYKLKKGTGALYNIAPTILKLLGLKKPKEMTKPLI